MQKQKKNAYQQVELKNYVWALIWYQVRLSRMSYCFHMNHFVGTPPFFRIILWIFTFLGGGGVNCSRPASLSQLFSLLFSDHFLSPVTHNFLFLNKWKTEKNMKECVVRKCHSGSACKWPSYSARWVAMDTMQFYVIQTWLFLKTISFWPTEQFCIHE